MRDQDLPTRRHSSGSALSPGAILDSRYEILDYIGQGGMGLVYKAHDSALDEVVAIKVLRPNLLDNQLMRQRFLSEIKLARRVTHKNVCRIHDYGEDGSRGYISMQFVDGVELKTLARQSPGLSVDEAYEIAIQLADGLQAIHDEGIIHRDFKSANVMVDARGHPRLMDFGIAKLWESELAAGLTMEGHVTGTPEYMSPEQAAGEPLDPRSDLYSMGIVLFELFTGTRPFTADNIASVLYKQIHDQPPLDDAVAAAIPPPVKPIIRRALAKRRDDRFSTADELKRALLDARAALATSVSDTTDTIVARVHAVRGPLDERSRESTPSPKPAATAPLKPERPRRISRRALWQLLTAASLVLVAVIGASNLLVRRAPGPEPGRSTGAAPPAATDRPSTAAERPVPRTAPGPVEREPPKTDARQADGATAPTQPAPVQHPPEQTAPQQTAPEQTATVPPPRGGLTATCERGDAGACLKACDTGVAAACTQLGLLYNRGGVGLSRDLGTAALYYERGCTGGDLAGCNNLGTLYQFGALGLRGDRSKATSLYERACTGGHLEACANLGSLYLEEPGASAQQRARARALLQKACSAGISRACGKIGP
jgi:serine/threonine protein kinase